MYPYSSLRRGLSLYNLDMLSDVSTSVVSHVGGYYLVNLYGVLITVAVYGAVAGSAACGIYRVLFFPVLCRPV